MTSNHDSDDSTHSVYTDFGTDYDRPAFEPGESYVVDVTSVSDGDTVKVRFDNGQTETVRVLGIDTPETPGARQYERPEEWPGIENVGLLTTWGQKATRYAEQRLANTRVRITFDTSPFTDTRDQFGRLLTYIYYDADGNGSRDTLYNREVVRDGHARVYRSGFSKFADFKRAEQDARADDSGLWREADPGNSSEIRNSPVERLFFPTPTAIRGASRVPVRAEQSASESGAPLVGIDDAAGVAMTGSLLIDENYEKDEGYDLDTSQYGNFTFLANLADSLSERDEGPILIGGGHGQFSAHFSLSREDAAYFLRFLEGFGVGFEQVNRLDHALEDTDARAVIISTAVAPVTSAELDALRRFIDEGGALVLMSDARSWDRNREHFNSVARRLGTDLRLAADSGPKGAPDITDRANSLAGDPAVFETSALSEDSDLFEPFEG